MCQNRASFSKAEKRKIAGVYLGGSWRSKKSCRIKSWDQDNNFKYHRFQVSAIENFRGINLKSTWHATVYGIKVPSQLKIHSNLQRTSVTSTAPTPKNIQQCPCQIERELNIERMAVSELEHEIYWGKERNVCFIKYNDTIFLSLPVI